MGVMEGMKPVAAMVVVQFVFAGVNIFYKLAVCDGMDMRVLVAYRFLFASAVLAPIAYFVERKKRPKVTWRVLLLSFVCGLCGLRSNHSGTLAPRQSTSDPAVAILVNSK